MSKRRQGFPSEKKVKRGVRIVHGNKELSEKLGRNDLCPCGSKKLFKKCCLKKGCFRRRESGPLFLGNEDLACLARQSRTDRSYCSQRLTTTLGQEACGGSRGQKYFPNRQENSPKNLGEKKTLPMRQVPQTKPETCEDSRSVVLSELLEGGSGE
jgi:hypothetical protein